MYFYPHFEILKNHNTGMNDSKREIDDICSFEAIPMLLWLFMRSLNFLGSLEAFSYDFNLMLYYIFVLRSISFLSKILV